MSIAENIKKIESLLPRTMLRDRALISYRLKKIKNPGKKGRDSKKSPADILSGLLARAEKSVIKRRKREA